MEGTKIIHTHGHTHAYVAPDYSTVLADIRKDVGDCQSTVKDSIHLLQASQTNEFRHVIEKACDAEKEAIKANLEVRIKILESECSIKKEATDNTGKILREICELKEDGLRNRVADAERRLAESRVSAQFQSTLDRILVAIAGIPVVTPVA